MSNKTMTQIDEAYADTQANIYAEKYAEQVGVYESMSMKTRIGEALSPYEVVALGQQLDQFSNYTRFLESQGNLGSLGAIPQIALDVITASVGASVLPLLSSIQPMSEEHGIVYYRQIKAAQASGGYNAGDVITDPLTRDNLGDGTLGSTVRKTVLFTTTTDTAYTGNIAPAPIRPYRLDINIPGVGSGKDDGNGTILGFGFYGTINYATGAFTIELAAAPTAGIVAEAIYSVDLDSASSVEKIQAGLLTKDIRAEVWALGADVGAFANFAFSNRFGRSAVDEVAQDLTNELTRVMNTVAIQRLIAAAPAGSVTTWKRQPFEGSSYAEHKLTFVDALATAESKLHAQAGAFTANRYIAGKTAAAVLRGMPGFQTAPDAATVSVGLFGYYDGIPVIRATGVVGDNDLFLVANAGNYFNAPLAYAPFMPLMVTNTVQSPNNPFRSTTAAGTWAGLTALNGNLVTKLAIDNTGFVAIA